MRDNDYEEEEYTEKIIVFNPAGFVLKIIFSVGLTALMVSFDSEDIMHSVFNYAAAFLMFWFIATLFGFCLRATGNYIFAAILLIGFIFLFVKGMEWLGTAGDIAEAAGSIVFIILLIWLPINDVRKAIIYFKNTI